MNFNFVLLDGFDILSAVDKTKQVFAEIISKEINSSNINQDKYTLNLTFNELLKGTWSIEFFDRNGDAKNSKRFRLTWYYALEDKNAERKYTEGKLAHSFVAEYYVYYEKIEEKEDNSSNTKEESTNNNITNTDTIKEEDSNTTKKEE